MNTGIGVTAWLVGALAATLATAYLATADWPGFRGPNGAGVTESGGLPVEFGPNRNLLSLFNRLRRC